MAYDYFVTGTSYRVGARRVTTSGGLPDSTSEIIVCNTSIACGRSPLGIASDGSDWLVAFQAASGSGVFAQQISAAGLPLDGNNGFNVSTGGERRRSGVSVAFASGNGYGVFWDDEFDVYGAHVSSGGTLLLGRTLHRHGGLSHLDDAGRHHDGTNYMVSLLVPADWGTTSRACG